MDQPVGPLQSLIRRDRAIALAGLAALSLLAWGATLAFARRSGHASMPGMVAGIAMPSLAVWHAADLLGLFAMWAVMMIAMMLPSTAPVAILVLGVLRRRHGARLPFAATGAFLGGYVLIWLGYSAAATLAQWALHSAALLAPDAMRAKPLAAGVLLLAAGVYQWTPFKRACLAHCRSPLHFFTTEWREGVPGALAMGLRHGTWCVGCCWLLMALLFVAGVMNLAWVAVLAALVLLERAAPAGPLIGRLAGVGLFGWGIWLALWRG